jgi:hypothetical protein
MCVRAPPPQIPMMFTFPSVKDTLWEEKHPDTETCQILVPVEGSLHPDASQMAQWGEQRSGAREDAYKELKAKWQEACLRKLNQVASHAPCRVCVLSCCSPLAHCMEEVERVHVFEAVRIRPLPCPPFPPSPASFHPCFLGPPPHSLPPASASLTRSLPHSLPRLLPSSASRTSSLVCLLPVPRSPAPSPLQLFPALTPHIDFVDVSTPLTIQHYLRKEAGGAVGLDQVPARFCDGEVQRLTDARSPIPGLWLTGQDTVLCGVPLVQLSGLITALRVLGLVQGTRFILQNVLWDAL